MAPTPILPCPLPGTDAAAAAVDERASKLVSSETTGRNYGSVVNVVLADDERYPLGQPASTSGTFHQQQQSKNGPRTSRRATLRQSLAIARTIIKTPGASFVGDVCQPGSIPHSMGVGAIIGVACGMGAYLYYVALEWLLETAWQTLPDRLWGSDSYVPAVLWIPLVAFVMATGVGWVTMYVGDPGNLAYTVQCVHVVGYVGVDHAGPMTLASLFSIVSGASLGPEAPLVAICASMAGFLSRYVFGISTEDRNLLRKHTLMGVCLSQTNICRLQS
jgi:hypothetical protein